MEKAFNLSDMLSSSLVRRRLQDMMVLSKKEKREAGFNIYLLSDRLCINLPVAGREHSMPSHRPAVGLAYKAGEGFFTEESSQVIVVAHTHRDDPRLSLGDSYGLWRLLVENWKIGNRDFNFWANPLAIVVAPKQLSVGYYRLPEFGEEDFDLLDELDVEISDFMSERLAVARVLSKMKGKHFGESCRSLQLMLKRKALGVAFVTRSCTISTLEKTLLGFESITNFEGESGDT